MSYYPNLRLKESGICIGDIHLPGNWIEGGSVKLVGQSGFHHRVTLTMFVEDIYIEAGAPFGIEALP